MKKILHGLFAVSLLAPATLSAASFEGKIDFTLTTARGQPQPLSYAIKNNKLRIELPGQKGKAAGMVVDPLKRESMMIMDEQKMYMVMAMPDTAAQAAGANAADVKIEKTGEREKILGYDAEKYISTHQDTRTELWLAEGLGTFASFSGGPPMGGGRRGGDSAPAPQAWEKALAGKELFPLRVVSKDKSGKESFRMEATAINQGPQPDSLFTPPADYKRLDMSGMMKGLFPGAGR